MDKINSYLLVRIIEEASEIVHQGTKALRHSKDATRCKNHIMNLRMEFEQLKTLCEHGEETGLYNGITVDTDTVREKVITKLKRDLEEKA